MSANGNGDGKTPGRPPVPELGPVPTVIVLGEYHGPEGRHIILQFHTPLGSASYFVLPEPAGHIGARLVELASKGSNRLIIPTVIPPGDLMGGPST
jgi:hypothetical protein